MSDAAPIKAITTPVRLEYDFTAGQAATMFLCGDDVEAKAMVTQLGADLGFEMLNAGPLTIARLLEPLAMLWISLAYIQGLGPGIAFKLLRR